MGMFYKTVPTGTRSAAAEYVGDRVEMIRTHHPFLHPTKGWRNFARPGKANRRRKLIPTGYLMVQDSHAYRADRLKWSPCRHQINS